MHPERFAHRTGLLCRAEHLLSEARQSRAEVVALRQRLRLYDHVLRCDQNYFSGEDYNLDSYSKAF